MNKAAFSLDNYFFKKVLIDLSLNKSEEFRIDFHPSGEFNEENSTYELFFTFKAKNKDEKKPFIQIECVAQFKFAESLKLDEIPPYFYVNSIAIIFPYMRAFISTVTLQSNIPPIVLPTMNLTDLAGPLKKNTKVKVSGN
jgi:preprotein translocase subunit SecB